MKINSSIFSLVVALICLASCHTTKVGSKLNTNGKLLAQEKYFEADKLRLDKDYKKAIGLYKECLQLQPNHAAANYFLAKCYNILNMGEQALPYAKKATILQQQNNYYRSNLAESYALAGQLDMAIVEYKRLAIAQPSLAESYLYKAAFYAIYQRKSDEAISIYNEVEKQFGFNEELCFKKIGIFRTEKQYARMHTEFDKLIAQDPTELNYRILKLETFELSKDSISFNSELKKLELNYGNDARIIPILVLNALTKGDTMKYKSGLQKAMSNKDISPEDKLNMLMPILAEAETDTVVVTELLQFCKQIVTSAPNDTKAIGIYASVLATAKKTKEAAEQFNILIKKDPSKLDIWQQLISLYAVDNNFDSIIAITNEAKNYFPNQSYFYMMQGIAYQQKEYYTQAIKAYNKALDYSGKSKEDKINIYTQLGDTYNSTKEYNWSDSCYEKALELDPRNESALNNYAYFLSLRKDNLDKAAKMSQLSLIVRPLEKTFLDTYAWILFQQGKYKEALEQMELALDSKSDGTLYEHYGDILFKLNRTEEAILNWKIAQQKGVKSKILDQKISTKKYYEQ
jgi:tetratricopeptide (TPR) repeat protein